MREQFAIIAPLAAKDPKYAPVLQALRESRQQNPLMWWEGYRQQREYLANRSLIKGFIGGNGTGKSTIGTVDDLIQVCDVAALPEGLRPFKRWDPPVFLRVAAPDEGVLDNTVLEKFREWTPKDQLVGRSFDKAYNKATRRLSFKNGSWVLFNTFKQDRDSWAGVEVRRTRFDEEPPGDHGYGLYTESMARLRKWMPDAQIAFTMTPLLGLTWVADEFERPDAWHVTAGIRDNVFLNDPEAVIAGFSHLSDAERKAVIEGLFVHFAGAVVILTPGHVLEPISPEFLKDKTVYVGIDPGIRRAGVVWAAFDADNSMLVFDELYPENQTVEQIAGQIHEKNAEWGVRRPLYVMDPSGRNRSLVNAESVETAFNQHGIFPMPGQNDRRAGVMQLRGRLEHAGLFVTENCVNLRWEAKRWLVATDEIISEGKAKVKGGEGTFATIGPDHLWDPTRYIAQERVWYSPARSSARRAVWTAASGVTPPKSLILRSPEPAYGPLGSNG